MVSQKAIIVPVQRVMEERRERCETAAMQQGVQMAKHARPRQLQCSLQKKRRHISVITKHHDSYTKYTLAN